MELATTGEGTQSREAGILAGGTDEEIAKYCTTSIALVKANQIAESYDPAVECIRRLQQPGAVAVVLGCTELPLAVPHKQRPDLGLEMADSIDGLAAASIRWYFETCVAVGWLLLAKTLCQNRPQ